MQIVSFLLTWKKLQANFQNTSNRSLNLFDWKIKQDFVENFVTLRYFCLVHARTMLLSLLYLDIGRLSYFMRLPNIKCSCFSKTWVKHMLRSIFFLMNKKGLWCGPINLTLRDGTTCTTGVLMRISLWAQHIR